MKTRTIAMVAIAVMIAVQFGAAGEKGKKFATADEKVTFATKNLIKGLNSANPGVVEASIRLTAQMKMRYPEANVTVLQDILNAISTNHKSGCVRYQAYIASNICSDPAWFTNDESVVSADQENFFRAASNRLQQRLYTTNIN
ncbi:MAG: hypothetical protein ACYC09_04435 [Bacteroidota bacterium]